MSPLEVGLLIALVVVIGGGMKISVGNINIGNRNHSDNRNKD